MTGRKTKKKRALAIRLDVDADLVGARARHVAHPLDSFVVAALENLEEAHVQTRRSEHWHLNQPED